MLSGVLNESIVTFIYGKFDVNGIVKVNLVLVLKFYCNFLKHVFKIERFLEPSKTKILQNAFINANGKSEKYFISSSIHFWIYIT